MADSTPRASKRLANQAADLLRADMKRSQIQYEASREYRALTRWQRLGHRTGFDFEDVIWMMLALAAAGFFAAVVFSRG